MFCFTKLVFFSFIFSIFLLSIIENNSKTVVKTNGCPTSCSYQDLGCHTKIPILQKERVWNVDSILSIKKVTRPAKITASPNKHDYVKHVICKPNLVNVILTVAVAISTDQPNATAIVQNKLILAIAKNVTGRNTIEQQQHE